jgi:hypothetical protein
MALEDIPRSLEFHELQLKLLLDSILVPETLEFGGTLVAQFGRSKQARLQSKRRSSQRLKPYNPLIGRETLFRKATREFKD